MSGLKKAQETALAEGAQVSPRIRVDDLKDLSRTHDGKTVTVVDFDVAVTAVDGQGAKTGAGLLVGVFGVGMEDSTKAESTSMSRVKFRVPVALP